MFVGEFYNTHIRLLVCRTARRTMSLRLHLSESAHGLQGAPFPLSSPLSSFVLAGVQETPQNVGTKQTKEHTRVDHLLLTGVGVSPSQKGKWGTGGADLVDNLFGLLGNYSLISPLSKADS